MKSIKYLKLALFALVIGLSATSCMDEDWTDPTGEVAPFGNNQLQETNVVSIADLKAKYGAKLKDVVNDTVRIADGVQIKGRVTGNDISGNIYSQVMLEDATGGIIISVAQGGINGQMQIGQEILVDLGGLYYGVYRTQPQLGIPYTDFKKNQTYPSRISRAEWQTRFKILGKPDASLVVPHVFETSEISILNNETVAQKYSGQIVTLKGVEFDTADGTVTFAPEAEGATTGYGVTRYFKGYTGQKKQIGIRTSCYAKFAAEKLPKGKLNVTGILTVYKTSATSSYGTTVQLVLRTLSDIEVLEPEKNQPAEEK